jgi:hypothetical protein
MAINKNHEFEELNGVKCGIVEKNANAERVTFLKELLEYNGFTVVTAPSPAPKAAPAPPPKEGETAPSPPPPPSTFTIGVTDYTFNWVNAIFGRQLHTKDGHVVTLAYWQQKDRISHDEVPYYESN